MSLSDEQWEFLQDVAKLIEYAKSKGYKLTGGELKRPQSMQLLYYYGRRVAEVVQDHLGLMKGPVLTKTKNSDHLIAMAIDLNIFYDYDGDGDLDYVFALSKEQVKEICQDLVDYWKSLNPKNYHGADWGWDWPHFGRRR